MILKNFFILIIFGIFLLNSIYAFSGGSGSEADPYQISTCSELQDIQNNLSSHFILIDDIDCDVAPYNADSGFNPIGCGMIDVGGMSCGSRSWGSYFTGTLDGNNHVINGLYINRSSESFVGLFGSINSSSSQIKDFNLVDVNINGVKYVGSVIGRIDSGDVNNITVKGNSAVIGSSTYTGGFVGLVYYNDASLQYVNSNADVTGAGFVGGITGCNYGDISYSSATGDIISSVGSVGGLVGIMSRSGTVSNSYATGTVTATSSGNAGGLIGSMSSNSGYTMTVSNSYSDGTVYGNQAVGGFVGSMYNSGIKQVYNCYSLSDVYSREDNQWYFGGFVGGVSSGTNTIENSYSKGLVSLDYTILSVGGFAGSFSNGTCNNCFWDTETSQRGTSTVGSGKTTTQMNNISTFRDNGWDFSTVWGMNDSDNDLYPFLLWQDFNSLYLNAAPDINLTDINGNDFNLTLPVFTNTDEILTINFSISDAENDLLYLDLNYSTSNTQNTGTNIFEDLNLSDLSNGVCTDNNFSDSIVDCSYDWNISNINDENYYIIAKVYDGSNNTYEISENYLGIDDTAPVITNNNSEDNWYNSDTNIALTCSDDVSGCNTVYYKLDTDSSEDISYGEDTWQTYSSPIDFNTDGNYALTYYGIDNKDFNSSTQTTYVLVDKTNPTVTIIPDTNVTTVLSSFDINYVGVDNTSQIQRYFISTDNETYSLTIDTNYLFAGNVGETKHLYLFAQDNADNNSETKHITVNFISGDDNDSDGILDTGDSIIGDSNYVNFNGNGLALIVGNVLDRSTASGLQTVDINQNSSPLISFDHNFDISDLNLSNINITTGSDYIIVDINSEIQSDQNKTIYLQNNDYDFICIKDELINSVDEISDSCEGTNEYKFTSCLIDGLETQNGISCTKQGNMLKFENLTHTAIKGFLNDETYSSGGSCRIYWSCEEWSEECIDSKLTRSCKLKSNCDDLIYGEKYETMSCDGNNENIESIITDIVDNKDINNIDLDNITNQIDNINDLNSTNIDDDYVDVNSIKENNYLGENVISKNKNNSLVWIIIISVLIIIGFILFYNKKRLKLYY